MHPGHATAAMFIVLLLTTAAARAEAVAAALRDVAVISTPTYTFADIASSHGARPALLNAEIGLTPRPGRRMHLTRAKVRARLARLDPAWSSIRWDGPAYVTIRGAGVALAGEAVREEARARLLAWLREHHGAGEIREVGSPRDLMVPEGRVTLAARIAPAAKLCRRMSVTVDVYVNGARYESLPQWFSVSVKKPVLVLDSAITAGERIDPAEPGFHSRDIAALRSRPLTDRASLSGMRAARDLEASAILTEADLEPVPPVTEGELITVRVVHRAVRITTSGVALSDGEVSQRISVRHPTNGRTYAAVVTGTNRARVD